MKASDFVANFLSKHSKYAFGGVILKEKEWKQMFKFLKYKGDYYFSGPKSYGL